MTGKRKPIGFREKHHYGNIPCSLCGLVGTKHNHRHPGLRKIHKNIVLGITEFFCSTECQYEWCISVQLGLIVPFKNNI